MTSSLKAIPLVSCTTGQFILNEAAVKKYFMQPEVATMDVAVISMVGALRQGKSFVLNFIIKFIQHVYGGKGEVDDWLDDTTQIESGFPWKGGSDAVTSGILMWPELFVAKNDKGDKMCILILDTQGTAGDSAVSDWSTVFALSTLASSIQVYNIASNIQENNFQDLQLFTEYGRLIDNNPNAKFQRLVFLVRDWPSPKEYRFGLDGGNKYVSKKFVLPNKHTKENQMTRIGLKTCYEEYQCFLLPFPGVQAVTSPDFDGKVDDLDENFIKHIKDLVPTLIGPKALIAKTIDGRNINVSDLFNHMKRWVDTRNSPDFPVPTSAFNTTAEINNLMAQNNATDFYYKKMNFLLKHYVNPTKLESLHEANSKAALAYFDKSPKMGGSTFSIPYREQLQRSIDGLFEDFKERNANRSLMKQLWDQLVQPVADACQSLLLPLIVIFLAVTFYLLRHVFKQSDLGLLVTFIDVLWCLSVIKFGMLVLKWYITPVGQA